MANLKIRHLVAKKNSDGTARHYWQPSAELRAAGWKPRRLAADQPTAIDQAEALNADVDAWRRGEVAPGAPAASPLSPVLFEAA